ncbi:adenine phosphoribosyltransferase [Holotrichia oblita]|nr:adenine phosphoribosyltransferase [Holotrichia oblita]
MDLKKIIRDIPDFPSKGIIFRDITPVLQNPESLCYAIDEMMEPFKELDFDLVIGPESRGFIFGVPIAAAMKKGFIPVRKTGKLPYEVASKSYELEYGTATIEIHKDAIKEGQKIVIVDDLLATGGTCEAICGLVEDCGGEIVCLSFLIELLRFDGRKKFAGLPVHSLLKY